MSQFDVVLIPVSACEKYIQGDCDFTVFLYDPLTIWKLEVAFLLAHLAVLLFWMYMQLTWTHMSLHVVHCIL